VVVHYLDKFGTEVGTHTLGTAIATGAKVNSNASNARPDEFGVYNDGTFGRGVSITGLAEANWSQLRDASDVRLVPRPRRLGCGHTTSRPGLELRPVGFRRTGDADAPRNVPSL